MSSRLESIRAEVKRLHDISKNDCIRLWFYEGHVALVARYAEEISIKVGANPEYSVLAALLHDLARTWGIKDDPELMDESLRKVEELMAQYGYEQDEIEQVQQAIIPHSCKEEIPSTLEGKVLATADALAHLMSDFYFILPYRGWLFASLDFEGYKKWLQSKIERDFHKKIFFEEYRDLAKPQYEAMKLLFS